MILTSTILDISKQSQNLFRILLETILKYILLHKIPRILKKLKAKLDKISFASFHSTSPAYCLHTDPEQLENITKHINGIEKINGFILPHHSSKKKPINKSLKK